MAFFDWEIELCGEDEKGGEGETDGGEGGSLKFKEISLGTFTYIFIKWGIKLGWSQINCFFYDRLK